MRRPRIRGPLAAIVALSAGPAALAGVTNLDENLPTEIEDAEPVDRGEREIQLPVRWDRERGGDNRFVVEPQLQWGFAERWQGSVSVRNYGGPADRTGSGDVRVKIMRKLADERVLLPAVAAFLELDLPSGKGSRGVDAGLRLAATKTLGERARMHQVHLNAVWTRNAAPRPEERPERVRWLAGYSTPLAEHTAFVADVIRQHERERGRMSTIAEVGMRRELAHRTIASFAVGTGRGSDGAPRWRLHAAFERAF